jgi:dTDP-4-amino-4,6-dideoxygalactose transaminase
LLEKLSIYADEIEARQKIARRYSEALSQRFATPYVPEGYVSVWAQYTLTLENAEERDRIRTVAQAAGVPTMVYYPAPLHKLKAYAGSLADPEGLSVSEALPGRVLSLPMHPYLEADVQDRIIRVLLDA